MPVSKPKIGEVIGQRGEPIDVFLWNGYVVKFLSKYLPRFVLLSTVVRGADFFQWASGLIWWLLVKLGDWGTVSFQSSGQDTLRKSRKVGRMSSDTTGLSHSWTHSRYGSLAQDLNKIKPVIPFWTWIGSWCPTPTWGGKRSCGMLGKQKLFFSPGHVWLLVGCPCPSEWPTLMTIWSALTALPLKIIKENMKLEGDQMKGSWRK